MNGAEYLIPPRFQLGRRWKFVWGVRRGGGLGGYGGGGGEKVKDSDRLEHDHRTDEINPSRENMIL